MADSVKNHNRLFASWRTALLRLLALCIAFAISSCVVVPHAPDPATVAREMDAHPERMIVLVVANPPETLTARAGTTAAGYILGGGGYSAGGSALAQVSALAKDYGLKEISAWPIPSLKVHCAVLEIIGDTSREKVLAELSADSRVRLAQPLQTFNLLGTTTGRDGYADLQQGFREIDAGAAHRVALGDSVRVALIDTGVDTSHPGLRDRIASAQNFVDDDWTQFNRDLHGTEVAGVIAADRAIDADGKGSAIEGVAPHARLIAIKACWQSGIHGGPSVCNSFTLAKAIQAALDAHAQIMNLSLGGPSDPLLTELVELSIKKGVIVVGAVLPGEDLKAFPVGVHGVIAVESARSAGDPTTHRIGQILYAPGTDILTLSPGGHYDFASGSSLAVAHVTGTVALLLELQPELDAHAIGSLLDRTSGPTKQHDRIINACRALAGIQRPCEGVE
ncbi:S8 family serine peptidase [Paraburkholderia acidicola]|uniref:S8 family serine peptidase n=1 Tax=Paraburkholderia acidicola TaxID=1912599 RepID=A0ABV1LRD0_9BURK